jgi:hypothetical protein
MHPRWWLVIRSRRGAWAVIFLLSSAVVVWLAVLRKTAEQGNSWPPSPPPAGYGPI